MKLINDLFKRYILIEDNLIDYGFLKDNNIYKYDHYIHNNEFMLQIFVIDGIIDARLIDLEFNDEYTLINTDNNNTFINSLKEEIKAILLDIRLKCNKEQYFIYPQTNRISNLIYEKYHAKPEFLWESFKGFAVFRNNKNNKWFALIGNVLKNKFIKGESIEVEIINLKLDSLTDIYLNNKGIYKAYHMSKKNWVSIILDDTLNDNEILNLIEISYNNI